MANEPAATTPVRSAALPAGFVGHGAPTRMLDPAREGSALRDWGASLGQPAAIVVVSAHWETPALTIGTTTSRDLIYDFSGFPPPLYRVRYDAPVAGWLAPRVEALLSTVPDVIAHGGVQRAPQRGWDHGVWTALALMFPNPQVPILQVSLPRWPLPALFRLGQALAPLRREGVLVLGSGSATHNLGMVDLRGSGPPPDWAVSFDAWLASTFAARDWDALQDAHHRAPAFRLAHPTDEHFTPLLVTAGAASDGETLFPISGWEFVHLSKRCIQLG